jgi:phosphatidylserine/phosphatidylglycerophosphate/cardiolipin synthase-like enzyme/membrane protein YqaA with SNARE-associated domain
MGFLIDGDAYFRALRDVFARARHSIFIVAWDIDSRTVLVPGGAGDGLPEKLGDFLDALVRRQKSLRIYALGWDFAMLYAFEREWLPVYKLDWRTHRRFSFRLDATHPVYASHHQKVIVVDDAIAFVGGLDLTQRRWDTREHRADEPLRIGPSGAPYGPFHDVQAVVDGNAARALGELVRERWLRSGAHKPRAPLATPPDLWPRGVEVDLDDVDVAIVRTEPPFDGRRPVHELREMHLDAIARARRFIFMENQYFTSGLIADALAARLREPDGPEIVLLTHRDQCGWLEESTMGILRARAQRRVADADAHDRFRAYFPEPAGAKDGCINIHSKVLVVDDEFLTVGSANLNNRSMGLDTECNIAVEARGEADKAEAIAGLRNGLLAEHLGVDPAQFAHKLAATGSLIATIEALRGNPRTLTPLATDAVSELDTPLVDAALMDPEAPVDPDKLLDDFVPPESRPPARSRLVGIAAFIFVLAALAAAWRFSPLHQWLNLDSLVDLGDRIDELPFTPLIVLGAYVIAGLLVVPVMLVITVTGIVFGPLVGGIYALAGALLSGIVTYAIGRKLGRETVRRFAGKRLNAITRGLAKRGLLTMILVRVVPVAPFTVVNVVAGASHIGWRDFLLGTALGMLPGIVATVVFVDRLIAAVRHPGPKTIALLTLIAAVLIATALIVHRRLAAQAGGGAPAS